MKDSIRILFDGKAGNGARQIRAVYEPSAEQAHKMQHKTRVGEPLILKYELEPNKRGLRNRRLNN